MASATIYADNKMQFYPTHSLETLRILSVLSDFADTNRTNGKEFEQLYDKELMNEFHKDSEKKSYNKYRVDYLMTKQPNLLEKYFEFRLKDVVVADLFGGNGSWLKLFKTFCNNQNVLIGNELETNRYNEMIEGDLIDYHYNLPFEDLDSKLPKKIINIMLFNPPYGSTNGERNVRRYLRIILERELMSTKSIMVLVIKKADALNVSDLLAKYFNVDIFGYKAHAEEYEKFKQIVLFAKLKDKPADTNNINDVAKYKENKEQIENYIEYADNTEFDYMNLFKHNYNKYTKIDLIKAMEDFKFIKQNKNYKSNKDGAWKWVLGETEIKDLSEEVMTIAKTLKSGELANVIASGKINGELSLENGIGKHVAVGGVKKVTEQKLVSVQDKKGNKSTKQETTIQSLPYLNLLINNKGKLEIKELKTAPNIIKTGDDEQE